MATTRNRLSANGRVCLTPEWRVDHPAVWVEAMDDRDGEPCVIMLRHPTYPFVSIVPDMPKPVDLDDSLRGIASEYVRRVALNPDMGIDREVVESLSMGKNNHFGWLRLAWGEDSCQPGSGTTRSANKSSFWVSRYRPAWGGGDNSQPKEPVFSAVPTDRTAVLLGGPRRRGWEGFGGEVGLRVVMHVREIEAGRLEVRVTGMSMSNLPDGKLLTSDLYRVLFAKAANAKELNSLLEGLESDESHVVDGVPDTRLVIDSISLSGSRQHPLVRLFAHGDIRASSGRHSLFFVGELPLDGEGTDVDPAKIQWRSFEERSRATDKGMGLDPASCRYPDMLWAVRPTRAQDVLDRFRAQALPAAVRLASRYFVVRQPRVGHKSARRGGVQRLNVGQPLELRSDRLSAAHTFVRAEQFFFRLSAYGFKPEHFFRNAGFPLILRHHAAIRGANDGNTINAQVRTRRNWPTPSRSKLTLGDRRPQLELRIGAAEIVHRSIARNEDGEQRAQHMGLAADARWIWHEFGHVLNYASIGRLEFRFAHSAGDALAAIIADPESSLASRPDDPFRFMTFPWVQGTRRHGRDVDAGWSWCGESNLDRRTSRADSKRDFWYGYYQEQLLSTSLFRLYRAIGGDTFGEEPPVSVPGLREGRAIRRKASDYVVYLIMRAISLLGPESIVPARSVDQFVSALIDADIGTIDWQVEANWPDPEDEPVRQVRHAGACVHKVIRWAFEQQGLYATRRSSEIREGRGLPPPVDLFIADRRRGSFLPGDGGYWPVPLRWGATDQPWHGHPDSINISKGVLEVKVRNRGQFAATHTEMVVRIARLKGGRPQAWTQLNERRPRMRRVVQGRTGRFRFDMSAARPGKYLVWASVSCPADRSTADPRTFLPFDPFKTDLVEMIANDNNQALWIRKIR